MGWDGMGCDALPNIVKSNNISDLVGFETFKGVREEVKDTASLHGIENLVVQLAI